MSKTEAVTTAPSPSATTPATSSFTPEMKAACLHVMAALVARSGPFRVPRGVADWNSAESEMYAAWRVGHGSPDKAFVEKLLPPGSLTPGDTQTLGEEIDVVAVECGIPLYN